MIERGLQFVAPHPCSNCGKVGAILCDDCKYDIIHEPFMGCFVCSAPHPLGICAVHQSAIQRSFVVGTRDGALETVINNLKFHNMKSAGRALAELLDNRLPILPRDVEIVPIPTIRSHIRQRGYDQVELIAQHLGRLRDLPVHHRLIRQSKGVQHTVGRYERQVQARGMFTLSDSVYLQGKTMLLIDDIITTGATLQAAAALLASAGAIVWVGALAYQPLD